MIYLADVLRGQLDPVFSFKDEHKSKQDFKIKYNVYGYWNAVSVGYANYHSIVMRTITLHTIHAGALENYTKSNNIKTNVNRNLIGNRGHSLCTDVPPPSGKVGRGDVCESPLLIVHKLYFCSSADGWKGTCRSKNSSGICAQASRTPSRNIHPKSDNVLRGSTFPRGIYSEVHSPITTPEIICVMALTLQPMRGCPQHSGETVTRLSSEIHRHLLSRLFLREGPRLFTGYRGHGKNKRNSHFY